MKFAKLFDIGDHQVLITKFYNEENESEELVYETMIDDINTRLAYGFKDKLSRDEAFDSRTQESAEEFLKTVLSLFENQQS